MFDFTSAKGEGWPDQRQAPYEGGEVAEDASRPPLPVEAPRAADHMRRCTQPKWPPASPCSGAIYTRAPGGQSAVDQRRVASMDVDASAIASLRQSSLVLVCRS